MLMFSTVARHLRRNVVAYLALFFALTSSGYAAVSRLLPPNSVGSAQVVNRSLATIDLSKPAVRALRGRTGPQGQAGPQGPAGPQGAVGPPGPAGTFGSVSNVEGPTEVIQQNSTETSVATCPANTIVVGGGLDTGLPGAVINSVTQDRPNGNTWLVTVANLSPSPITMHAVALCATH
jgi:hypothetical protein